MQILSISESLRCASTATTVPKAAALASKDITLSLYEAVCGKHSTRKRQGKSVCGITNQPSMARAGKVRNCESAKEPGASPN